jgi:uncharacterized membrane protein YtjA (UPF0391 family)
MSTGRVVVLAFWHSFAGSQLVKGSLERDESAPGNEDCDLCAPEKLAIFLPLDASEWARCGADLVGTSILMLRRPGPIVLRMNSTPSAELVFNNFELTGTAGIVFRFFMAPEFGEEAMGNLLHYAIVFLVVALIAAAVGFGGVAGVAMEGARILFWVFIVLFVISLVANFARRA